MREKSVDGEVEFCSAGEPLRGMAVPHLLAQGLQRAELQLLDGPPGFTYKSWAIFLILRASRKRFRITPP